MADNTLTASGKAPKTATLHWLMQRVTAIILIPLTWPLLVFLDLCMTVPYQQNGGMAAIAVE